MNGATAGGAAIRIKIARWIRRYGGALTLGGALVLTAYWAKAREAIGVYPFAAMAIGGLVGGVELAARYRHAPVRAATSWSGAFYVLLNVAASWAAFFLISAFGVFDLSKPDQELKATLLAGFGSLVFMRSSLFRVRVGDADIGVGPAAVLDTLLLIADRGVDRREAVARAQDVSALVSHVNDPRKVATMLTKYSLALMQNVDEKTSQDLAEAIGKILSDTEVPDAIKIDIVALRLGVVVGPDVLEAAVSALGDRLATGAGIQPPQTPPAPTPQTAPAPTPQGPPAVGALKDEIDFAKFVTYLRDHGIKDPDVDTFWGVISNNIDVLNDALSRGGKADLPQNEIKRRYKEWWDKFQSLNT